MEVLSSVLETPRSLPEIATLSGMSPSTVRRHVEILLANGLVEKRGESNSMFVGVPEKVDILLDEISWRLLHQQSRAARLNAAVLASETTLRTLFAASPSPVIQLDREGICVSCNPAAEKVFGYAETEFVQFHWRHLLSADSRIEPKDFGAREVSMRRKNGADFPARVEISTVRRTDGEIAFMYATVTDLTEQKLAEQLAIEVGVRTKESHAKTQFIATMSHELRTPLNAVLGFADLLSRDNTLSERDRRWVERIMGGGARLLKMVDNVLDLANLDAGTFGLEVEQVSLSTVVHETVEKFSEIAGEKGLLLTANVGPEIHVRTDRRAIVRVLDNLISNAVTATTTGAIRLGAVASDGDVLLSVSDTGSGIPPSYIERMFQPFTQIEEGTTRSRQGAGLGLAICHRLLRAVGADIAVSSVIGQGTTFTIKLPQAV